MNISKKQLAIIIEAYLQEDMLSESLAAIDDTGYEVPRCDFQYDPEFLNILTFIKTGERPGGYTGSDTGKPDMFNPLFLKMLTNDALPFMNLMVTPVFGIKAKCSLMRKMQNLFNEMYREFTSGFAYDSGAKERKEKVVSLDTELAAKQQIIYDEFFKNMPSALRGARLQLNKERKGSTGIVDSPPGNLSRAEAIYASFILGDLSKAKARDPSNVVNAFRRAKKANTVKSLLALASKGRSIPGYDANDIKRLIRISLNFFKSENEAMTYTHENIIKLFDKLKSLGIIQA
jgi:hypothetical protein|tara:strand:+ start:4682 stop:5548 length:867 start_codon:yes stop_codon:yes gene_type:complete